MLHARPAHMLPMHKLNAPQIVFCMSHSPIAMAQSLKRINRIEACLHALLTTVVR
jgi:hypothetical protein